MKGINSFERLDQSYLEELTVRAGKGDSNAFAELFAALSGRQLCYLYFMFGDRGEAVDALKQVFINVMRGLPLLHRPDLITIWLSRLSFNEYLERTGTEKAVNKEFTLSQLLNLPPAESQIMIMRCEQGLTEAEAGAVLNAGGRTVRRFVRLARKHLSRGAGSGQNEEDRKPAEMNSAADGVMADRPAGAGIFAAESRNEEVSLTPVESSRILQAVYDACGASPNTVPAEALSSYAIYRKERFSLQRGILTAALAVFLMLPALFILPSYTVEVTEKGDRGLPVYTIDVSSALPVGKVLAAVRDHSLPVYEAGSGLYTVEPTRNGELKIEVELINHQRKVSTSEVTAVDAKGPELISDTTEGDKFILRVRDAGIGVDYRDVYAKSASGKTIKPVSADEEGIVFEYPEEAWDIYIPDHIGNTLHLTIKVK